MSLPPTRTRFRPVSYPPRAGPAFEAGVCSEPPDCDATGTVEPAVELLRDDGVCAVIGGVVSSTLLSLIVVPVFYLAIENTKAFLSRKLLRRSPRKPARTEVSGLASVE